MKCKSCSNEVPSQFWLKDECPSCNNDRVTAFNHNLKQEQIKKALVGIEPFTFVQIVYLVYREEHYEGTNMEDIYLFASKKTAKTFFKDKKKNQSETESWYINERGIQA